MKYFKKFKEEALWIMHTKQKDYNNIGKKIPWKKGICQKYHVTQNLLDLCTK